MDNSRRKEYVLSRDVLELEKTCGHFVACLTRQLPEALKPLAFCGPASCRDPELDNIWHPYLLKSHFLAFIRDQAVPLIHRKLRGMKKFILYRFGEFTYVPKDSPVLGVSPTMLCRVEERQIHTTYCHPEEAQHISWFLFDETNITKGKRHLSRISILGRFFQMLYGWGKVSFSPSRENKKYWAIASIITLRWILELQWVNQWLFSLELGKILDQTSPQRIFCVHEMHPHSRLIWAEAKKKNIATVTVLHARLSRGELWYYPTRDELEAGLQVFDEITVFSQRDIDLLKDFYGDIPQYHMGCGPRFFHWKTQGPLLKEDVNKKSILFATSLPWWDNEIIFCAMEKLLHNSPARGPLSVRFHPTAEVPKRWQKWLSQMKQEGRVCVSNGSLADAILSASVIIGLNTTVLEEGLLMGRAALAIEQDRFTSFASIVVEPISLEDLSWEEIEKASNISTQCREENMALARKALGLDYPEFKL